MSPGYRKEKLLVPKLFENNIQLNMLTYSILPSFSFKTRRGDVRVILARATMALDVPSYSLNIIQILSSRSVNKLDQGQTWDGPLGADTGFGFFEMQRVQAASFKVQEIWIQRDTVGRSPFREINTSIYMAIQTSQH